MGPTAQESRKRAKVKLEKLPNVMNSKSSIPVARLTLGIFLNEWLTNEHQQHIAHTTYKRYASLSSNHIVPCIGSVELQKVTQVDIQRVLTKMREAGQSPRSQQQARALLSIALGAAVNKDFIAINPVYRVKNPVNKSREMKPLTADEVRRLLQTYKGTLLSARLHIALLGGLRQGEALGLRWQDVDFENGLIHVRVQIQTINGKREFIGLKTNRSRRSIALTQTTLEALKLHKVLISQFRASAGSEWVENELVFPEVNGMPKSSTIDYQEWRRALKLCGIKSRKLHEARHTAATLMYSQGIGIEVISRALGHSTSAITSKLYVHTDIRPQIAAAKLLEAAIREC
jgi:integrase